MNVIAQTHGQVPVLRSLMSALRRLIAQRGAHPARTVVLLPFAQLLPVAKKLWAQEAPTGFAPRFETTMNWAGAAGFVPSADDISFDMGRDLLTAHSLLQRAGMSPQAELLSSRLVEAAWQLAGVVAAVRPAGRPAWAANARPLVAAGMDGPGMALEAAVALPSNGPALPLTPPTPCCAAISPRRSTCSWCSRASRPNRSPRR
jgi:ATP-dependent helicase/nuclease subunit B